MIFPQKGIILRNKQELTALNKKSHKEHPRSSQAWDTNVRRPPEDYITKISEELEGRVAKKLSHKFIRTENCILGPLSRFEEFLLSPLVQGVPGPFWGRPGRQMEKTRKKMRIVPWRILILKRGSRWVSISKNLTQQKHTAGLFFSETLSIHSQKSVEQTSLGCYRYCLPQLNPSRPTLSEKNLISVYSPDFSQLFCKNVDCFSFKCQSSTF